VIALPHMANFTDFDALASEPAVSLKFLQDPAEVADADILILPGSKQTLDDLAWLRARGFADAISRWSRRLIGICGGFQMLGVSIEDPEGVESEGIPRAANGLGLLPVRTVMRGEKTVRRITGRTRLWDSPCFHGYEIHMGETVYENGAKPFAGLPVPDGAADATGRVWGTYVHGIFDDDAFRHSFLDHIGAAGARARVAAQREARIDRWANHLRQSLDLRLIRQWINL
jgi:adenosylcobyric acid synthase